MAPPALLGDLNNRFIYALAVAALVNQLAGRPVPWPYFFIVGLWAIGEAAGHIDVIPETWERELGL